MTENGLEKQGQDIKQMFSQIAPRYDLLNHILSMSLDRLWRKAVAHRMVPLLKGPKPVLDLCTGTGDLAFELVKQGARVVGCDFCHPMLVRGLEKRAKGVQDVKFVEGDALKLPFPGGCFSGVAIGFGLRNLEEIPSGLEEMNRVLVPNGLLAVLEFAIPRLVGVRHLYLFYFDRILPRIGSWVSGQSKAYRYLPQSVSGFPDSEAVWEALKTAGFSSVYSQAFTLGICRLYLGRKVSGRRP